MFAESLFLSLPPPQNFSVFFYYYYYYYESPINLYTYLLTYLLSYEVDKRNIHRQRTRPFNEKKGQRKLARLHTTNKKMSFINRLNKTLQINKLHSKTFNELLELMQESGFRKDENGEKCFCNSYKVTKPEVFKRIYWEEEKEEAQQQ